MRFMSILIKEGRKEDLKKKYSNKFDAETLDWILDISDLQEFNHKYTDWVLLKLKPESESFDNDVEYIVELIKDFDKYQSQFPKKDINQYVSVSELDAVVNHARTKKIEKELENKVDKIYEDDKFSVIKPQTEQASCKYGSNTKWCVTSKGSGHFQRYTSGRQGLYFIINKKNSTNKNYSKIAIHFDDGGYKRYWDSQDNPMNDREISVLNYAFPEIIEAIDEDYKKHSMSNTEKLLNQIFNIFSVTKREESYLGITKLGVSVEGFETINDLGPGHAYGSIAITLNNTLIDSYEVFITFRALNEKYLEADIGFQGNDPNDEQNFIDLGLEGWGFKNKAMIQGSPEIMAEGIRNHIANKTLDYIRENQKLTQKVAGTSKVWRPNRSSYGYTFKSADKGLVKKLVDWLDASKIGTKLDFLSDIGKLEKKIEQGKPLYSFPNKNRFEPPTRWRGQFSSFFAAAKNAGILNYRKIGKEYFLIKGPNFDAFKKGELKAL